MTGLAGKAATAVVDLNCPPPHHQDCAADGADIAPNSQPLKDQEPLQQYSKRLLMINLTQNVRQDWYFVTIYWPVIPSNGSVEDLFNVDLSRTSYKVKCYWKRIAWNDKNIIPTLRFWGKLWQFHSHSFGIIRLGFLFLLTSYLLRYALDPL